jgi:hypothetical protein
MRVMTSSPMRPPPLGTVVSRASRTGTILTNEPLGTVVKPFTCSTDWKTT